MDSESAPENDFGPKGRNDDDGTKKDYGFFTPKIYAANEDNANAFHRTIYVFTSARGDKLGEEGRVRAFRSQLGRENAFYGMHPAPENPE